MFQRLKGFNLDSFLDGKIAEEPAKQGRPASSASSPAAAPGARRSPSTPGGGSRRSSARPEAGGRRSAKVGDGGGGGAAAPAKGPDPEEFVIGDDVSDISRATTPVPVKEEADGPVAEQKEAGAEAEAGPEKIEKEDVSSPTLKGKSRETGDELPEDVRKKLAKLESLTTKYQDLLRNYRTAHARVSAVEPFEAMLREHTPLASISDPSAFVEFLNQRSLQSEMVMEELKRVSAENREIVKERDELKGKLDAAEKRAKEAFDEAAGLSTEKAADGDTKSESKETDHTSDRLGANLPETGAGSTGAATGADNEDETFFSYETELPRLEAEIKQQHDQANAQRSRIAELSAENATLRSNLEGSRQDLTATRESIEAKDNKISDVQSQLADAARLRDAAQEQEKEATSSLVAVESQLDDLKTRLQSFQEDSEARAKELQDKLYAAQDRLQEQEESRKTVNGGVPTKDLAREKKMKEIHQNVINHLRDEAAEAEKAKRIAEGRMNELHFEIKKLESEASTSGQIITRLRDREDAAADLQKQLEAAERERDEARRMAESKKGHEAAVASLRSQLRRMEKDRDAAYRMIIDCGKCDVPDAKEERGAEVTADDRRSTSPSRNESEVAEQTEVSTQPTEANMSTSETPVAGAGESKNKKKKKKNAKAKKEAAVAATSQSVPESAGTPATPADNQTENSSEIEQSLFKHVDRNTVESSMADFISASVGRVREKQDEEEEEAYNLLRHKESMIEEREQEIREKGQKIGALQKLVETKTSAFEENVRRMREGEEERESLKEANEDLKDSLTELGTQATDAKHELKQVQEQRVKQQEELEELEAENERQRKSLKEVEAQRDVLKEKCGALEAEVVELQTKQGTANLEQVRDLEEKLKSSQAASEALHSSKEACEKQIQELKAQSSAISAEVEGKLRAIEDETKSRTNELEKDLAASNQLAQARFKDLTDLREHVNNVQPELKKLREESVELKKLKTDLDKSSASVKRLEAREKDLRSEISEYKSQVTEKDREVVSLQERAKRSEERNLALEDTYDKARKDLEQNEKTRDEAVEARDKVQGELKKVKEELKKSKPRLEEMEKQVNKLGHEASSLRDELGLKTAQQASAQSLMDSMQDQTRELATQMKEVKDRNDSLEEELSDAHRLLSERGREGETMRRLLADVEARADSRIKEMRERMDLATEERDRAEDEANGIGRRKTREVEELKGKLRDAEHELDRAKTARVDAEKREREFREREDELRRSGASAQEELAEVRAAMAQLRDALDEGERQSRELEREKAELRKTIGERETRLEKLQKSSKGMAEELRSLQTATGHAKGGRGVQSPARPSTGDSSTVTSPAPPTQRKASNAFPAASGVATTGGPQAKEAAVDYVYLKNVLLQFVEQRDKKHQMQLVPVLAMLLHFDRQDEQKWMSAISTR